MKVYLINTSSSIHCTCTIIKYSTFRNLYCTFLVSRNKQVDMCPLQTSCKYSGYINGEFDTEVSHLDIILIKKTQCSLSKCSVTYIN